MRVMSLLVGASLLCGCATSPTNISAAYVSPLTFTNLTCDQVDTEIMATDTKAADLYGRLKHRANGDAWKMGVGLLVTWPALLFLSGGNGPEASEYAMLKGQKDALIDARRHCSGIKYGPATTNEMPGTVHMGRVTLVPATTATGFCIIAPAGYVGTGASNMPAVTTAMPRCSSMPAI
jgi:hypothetical protein